MNMLTLRRNPVNPWLGFREIEEQLDRLLGGTSSQGPECRVAWTPAVDLQERESEYVLRADLPGLTKEDITLTVEEDVVTLKGSRKEQKDEPVKGYHRIERAFGEFSRAFRIPSGIDAGKVEAKFEHGVLEVKLPKPETAKPKQIEVTIG